MAVITPALYHFTSQFEDWPKLAATWGRIDQRIGPAGVEPRANVPGGGHPREYTWLTAEFGLRTFLEPFSLSAAGNGATGILMVSDDELYGLLDGAQEISHAPSKFRLGGSSGGPPKVVGRCSRETRTPAGKCPLF